VKLLMRGVGLALLMVSSWALAGCGVENESEAERAQKNLGAVPTASEKGVEKAEAPPASYDQRKPPEISPGYSKQAKKK
jgi:hypothetical protein